MRTHDGAADREPKAHADDRPSSAALKLVEQASRPPRQARPFVVDRHAHASRQPLAPRCARRPGRRVLRDVVEQIDEHLHDRGRIDMHRRQVGREIDVDGIRCRRSSRRASAVPTGRRGLPVPPQSDLPRFEAHEVEHVRDQLRHLARLGLDRARQRLRVASSSRRRAPRACCPRRPSRQAACASRARSTRAACCAGFRSRRPRARPRRSPRAARARRKAELAGERLEQMALLGQQHAPRFSGSTASTPRRCRSSLSGNTTPAPPAACRSRVPRACRDRPPIARSTGRASTNEPSSGASRG